jgi:8-oxo-dGTP diphosphatase
VSKANAQPPILSIPAYTGEIKCEFNGTISSAQRSRIRKMRDRYIVYPRTLIFLLNGDDILLIRRSPNARLFPGMYNGVGGHVERGEDVLSSAQREIREETGLDVPDLSLRCLLNVDEGAGQPGVLLFVFVGHTEHRDVTASGEGTLHWVPLAHIGELNLLPDLPPLLAHVLALPADAAPVFARSTITPDGVAWEIEFRPSAEATATLLKTSYTSVDPPSG